MIELSCAKLVFYFVIALVMNFIWAIFISKDTNFMARVLVINMILIVSFSCLSILFRIFKTSIHLVI
jgi:tryptophan-rich sensory protein